MALLIALLAIGLCSAMALGGILLTAGDRLSLANEDDAQWLLNAADAALELAIRDLARIEDWNTVLDGSRRSPMADGPPEGTRSPWSTSTVDLTLLTNHLTCGASSCTDQEMRASAQNRPWGGNNARWRPFLFLSLEPLTDPTHQQAPYVVVWLGDDSRERDGDPFADGGGPASEGRYILRARAEAFGPQGERRSLEADLARVCRVEELGEVCLPGLRVLAWRAVDPAP
ncbi:MAG: hypothetical protein ACT4QD_15405 [Acidobacteriota bacterium]